MPLSLFHFYRNVPEVSACWCTSFWHRITVNGALSDLKKTIAVAPTVEKSHEILYLYRIVWYNENTASVVIDCFGNFKFCYFACFDSGLCFWLIIFDFFDLSKVYFKLIEAYGKLIDGLHFKKLKYSRHLMLIRFILIQFKLRSCSLLILCICIHGLVILEVPTYVNLMQVCVWKFHKVRLQFFIYAVCSFVFLFELWVRKKYFEKLPWWNIRTISASYHHALTLQLLRPFILTCHKVKDFLFKVDIASPEKYKWCEQCEWKHELCEESWKKYIIY